ncbi:MAG: glycosyltransferase family 4 protein [Patescibacteria group bacterium]
MKITWLIPTTGLTGGVKVIFEHANRLQRRGHQVTLVYPYILPLRPTSKMIIFGYLKMLRRFFISLFKGKGIGWFNLDKGVILKRVRDLSNKNLPDGDIIIATANETADWLNICAASKGKKFYFIQDYETWTRNEAQVDATWRMPFKKIVISSWLKDLAKDKFHEPVAGLVFNGVDLETFTPKDYTRESRRGKINILMLYHVFPKKGFIDGLTAYNKAKEKYPNLELSLFSVYRPRQDVPADAKFYYRPSRSQLKNLYQAADIFLWPSRVEGFGLPPLEAMACGTAVITTATGAAFDYARDGENAVVVYPSDINAMVDALEDLIKNSEKRTSLGAAAAKMAQEFSWEKSNSNLENLLLRS